ncbi:transcription repressor OFP6-like [Mercurialis annua]|uniref:transcription repressor OFP6-like n=1 Tax=Mercurialis annua TaxID=3986 RepID=UPI0021601BE3|nr:transcription repressor OFP6-like [Mercurialis annua]
MPSRKKIKLLKTLIAACGCGRTKPSDVYEPIPIPIPIPLCPSDSNSYDKSGSAAALLSLDNEETCTTSTESTSFAMQHSSETKISNNSIAVVKDSNDPYRDFRQSMLQMIFEKEIFSRADLQELLNCYLELNAACNHALIIGAFTDIWNDVISKNQT